MPAIRGTSTRPELAVRRLLHGKGFRFRPHARGLRGAPDIVVPRHGLVVFVHGCFWHRHAGRCAARVPGSSTGFGGSRLARNVARDRANRRALRKLGWRVAVVWEYRPRDLPALRRRFRRLLKEG